MSKDDLTQKIYEAILSLAEGQQKILKALKGSGINVENTKEKELPVELSEHKKLVVLASGVNSNFHKDWSDMDCLVKVGKDIIPPCEGCPVSQHLICYNGARKALDRKALIEGMPYTEKALNELPPTNLTSLLGVLKINAFKMEDGSKAGRIKAILAAQKKIDKKVAIENLKWS